jgi:hypothetical protein
VVRRSKERKRREYENKLYIMHKRSESGLGRPRKKDGTGILFSALK